MKSEPTTFSFDDLVRSPKKTTAWEGVRNYQARNFMRDQMKRGDAILFYHSNATPPAIIGIASVVRESYPDPTQFKKNSKYFDPKATLENPRWFLVDIQADRKFSKPISLEVLRKEKSLSKMMLLQKGSRLSVQPVTKKEWDVILKIEEAL